MNPGETSHEAQQPDASPPSQPSAGVTPPSQPSASQRENAPQRRGLSKNPLQLLLGFFSSLGLSILLLIFLGLLTYFGTMAQVEIGIHNAQKRYFESLYLVEWIGGRIPLLLPGGYLVMTLLTINLIVGGVFRMRWNWRRLGVLIAHLGIAFLFVSALVKDLASHEGYLSLYEGEKAAHFQSYTEYELAITERQADGSWKEQIIPEAQLKDLLGSKSRTFSSKDLPFSLTVSHWFENCRPTQSAKGHLLPASDGEFALVPLPSEVKAERNIPGALLRIRDKADKQERRELLFGLQDPVSLQNWKPIYHESGGKAYAIELRQRLFPLPFELELEDFHHEFHPGTRMPKSIESYVFTREDGVQEKHHIWMNHPLRKEGFVLFQTNWGPKDDSKGPFWSVFSIVHNPSDQWPTISCIIITLGLLLHYGVMLVRFIRREAQ
ncbi:MAG: hypothetical protein CSA62_15045 [Planctomycetota bacterium]|nr:MAG: hypothetical protein CSA62_15045 [Planctomycetota bacterium]